MAPGHLYESLWVQVALGAARNQVPARREVHLSLVTSLNKHWSLLQTRVQTEPMRLGEAAESSASAQGEARPAAGGARRLWPVGQVGHNPHLPVPFLRLLSRDSPSGAMKAVLRKAGGTSPGEEKQFLEVSPPATR